MQSHLEPLPAEISCATLQSLPIEQALQLYNQPRWKEVIDTCPWVFAGRQEAVHIPLQTLIAWPWTRQIKYVLTDFPPEREKWAGLLAILAEQPVLAINVPRVPTEGPRDKSSNAEHLKNVFSPLPGTKRIVIAGNPYPGFLFFAAVGTYEGRKIGLNALIPEETASTEIDGVVEDNYGTPLNNNAYELLAHVDLGLVDPLSPPGPNNGPLRDVLTMFWTYIAADPYRLYRIMAHLGDIARRLGEEGNWIWGAPYLEKMGELRRPQNPRRRLAKRTAYLRKYNVQPTPLLEYILRFGPNLDSQGPINAFAANTINGPVEAMASEIPYPYPGESIRASVDSDDNYLEEAERAYNEEYVYLVNGRFVPVV